MWNRRKKKAQSSGQAPAVDPLPAVAAAATTAAPAADGASFSHPGGFGAMMVPPEAVKVGFFAGRRRRRQKEAKSNGDTKATDASGKQQKQPQQQGQHPLCSADPARIDGLLSEAREAKEAKTLLQAEAVKLRAAKDALDRDIQRLQRDKANLTESHLAELEHLRREFAKDAEDGKRRLKSELEKGHAQSMDRLRLTLKSETEHLAGETKRLRDDLLRTRQARAAASGAGAAAGVVSHAGSKAKGDRPAALRAGETPLPSSPGFWSSLTSTFTPRDFLDPGQMAGVVADGVAPPALLVLVAVPLFCFYRRWRLER